MIDYCKLSLTWGTKFQKKESDCRRKCIHLGIFRRLGLYRVHDKTIVALVTREKGVNSSESHYLLLNDCYETDVAFYRLTQLIMILGLVLLC